jgi:hypothetical protein
LALLWIARKHFASAAVVAQLLPAFSHDKHLFYLARGITMLRGSDFPTGKIRDDMITIHFTYLAADPLAGFGAIGARFLLLMEGQGNSDISCLNLDSNSKVASLSLAHAAALICVHGRIIVTTRRPQTRIDIHAGMGCAFDAGERFAIESTAGAIVLVVESDCLSAQERGISTPARIAGATWPGEK